MFYCFVYGFSQIAARKEVSKSSMVLELCSVVILTWNISSFTH
uniref:Uncharacterized protein n=1 Tax=Rhizophora mucronata TaxID=61149 RepID=A0A2P2NWS3_RHIMU